MDNHMIIVDLLKLMKINNLLKMEQQIIYYLKNFIVILLIYLLFQRIIQIDMNLQIII